MFGLDVQSALRASGLRIRFVPVRPDAGWMFEPLDVVARRAVGLGICRRVRRVNRMEV